MPARIKAPREEVRRLHDAGLPEARIAEELGVSLATVRRVRKALGLETGWHARQVTPERLARIEAMLDDGLSFLEIHRTEGADLSTLRRYFPGRAWTLAQRAEFAAARRLWDAVDAAPYAARTRDLGRAQAFNRLAA